MKPHSTGARRVRHLAGALVAAGALALLGVAPAMADTGPDIPENLQSGTITLHKFESPTTPEVPWPNDGSPLPAGHGLVGMPGVTFTVTPLTVDLTTNAGWTQAKAWADSPSSIPAASKGTPFTLVTGPSGSITSGTLSMGAYLIEETHPGTHNIVFTADPFVVTIPLPTTVDGDTTWLNHIHVYPKNGVTNVVKGVDDSGAHAVGDSVTWNVSVEVPGSYGVDETITSFEVGDILHEDLRFIPGSVTATLTPTMGPALTLTTTDGTLSVTVVDPPAGATHGETVTFGVVGSALADIQDYAGGTLAVSFDTMVTGAPGEIKNVATASFNDVEFDSNEVMTKWVAVEVFKFEHGTDPKNGLAGAEFQVFTQATGGTPLSFLTGQDGDGNDVFSDTFTTGPDGTVVIPGLKLGGSYWLEETKAPERFMQLEDRIAITGLEITHTISNPLLVEVPNTEIPDWQLPLTGGAGTLVPMIGLGMMLLATGSALVATKRGKRSR